MNFKGILPIIFSLAFLSLSAVPFFASPYPSEKREAPVQQSFLSSSGLKSETEGEETVTVRREYTDYFATIVTFQLLVPQSQQALAEETCERAEAAIAAIESAVSVSLPESDIARFNDQLSPSESMQISAETYALLSLAKNLYVRTEGAYDPSVALLVDLWGFSPRFYTDEYIPCEPYDRQDYRNELPQERYIEAFQTLAAFDEVSVYAENGIYSVTKPKTTVTVDGREYAVKLDLGGIAKGYACDVAAGIFAEYGFVNGNISVGDSSVYLLRNSLSADGKFTVKVQNPRAEESGLNGDTIVDLRAKECGLSTSGDYERYYVTHNIRYCHIISAETGKPIDTDICTACIVGGSAAENDALTTAVCVMGKERAIEFITEELKDKQAFFVWENAQTGKYEIIANCEKSEITLNTAANGFVLCGYMQDGTFVYEPSFAFDPLQLVIGAVIAVAVVAVVVGLGYRNHVLKRNQTSTKE